MSDLFSYTDEDRTEDFNWYVENLLDLFFRYGKKYVAIHKKVILGVYDDFADACRNTDEYYEPGTYIVQKLGPDKSAYTIDGPLFVEGMS